MHARVSTFEGSEAALARAQSQGEEIAPVVRGIAGNRGLIVLIDRDTGRELTITLWDTADAMRSSEETANRIRKDSADEAGETIVGVDRYEVALFDVDGAS